MMYVVEKFVRQNLNEKLTVALFLSSPPLNKVSLFFEESQMERDYKRTAWKLRDAKHSPSLAAVSCETTPSGRILATGAWNLTACMIVQVGIDYINPIWALG